MRFGLQLGRQQLKLHPNYPLLTVQGMSHNQFHIDNQLVHRDLTMTLLMYSLNKHRGPNRDDHRLRLFHIGSGLE